MFVGHTAIALLARRRTPSVGLGVFLLATFALDLLWPFFLLIGIEEVRIQPGTTAFTPLVFASYPWSHSLLMAMVWGALATMLCRARSVAPREAVLVGGVVVSHWILDLVTHVPDLPLVPGGSVHVGLGLWRSMPATYVVEGALYLIAIALYFKSTQPDDRVGSWGLWGFLIASALLWASGPFAPPPPTQNTLAWAAMVSWALVAWGAWSDHHRSRRLA